MKQSNRNSVFFFREQGRKMNCQPFYRSGKLGETVYMLLALSPSLPEYQPVTPQEHPNQLTSQIQSAISLSPKQAIQS
jgi:hypothetical protein